MSQQPLFNQNLWKVSEINRYLRDLLESDSTLQDLWVQGEVSNLSRPASGHLYFTLKDETGSLRCVMWRSTVHRQGIIPENGDAVEAHGSISVYETAGQYQLYVDILRPAGEGLLYAEFIRLKSQLEAEGLFDQDRKQPIPARPKKIGIVTSPTGAAIRDIIHTINRRYPFVEVVVAPAQVQGIQAPGEIIAAIKQLNRLVEPDIIIVARGGGSIEDLWAFNDEGVARAIAISEAPVISGIGHETDFTIADFVSDLRAPTPTAAAELATPSREELLAGLQERQESINATIRSILSARMVLLSQAQNSLLRFSPLRRLQSDRQRVDEYHHRLSQTITHRLKLKVSQLGSMNQQLASLNPRSVLNRGFSSVSLMDGTIVRSIQQVKPLDELQIRVTDGKITGKVERVNTENE